MTQSFPFRDPDSELAPEAVLTRPNMMPPWKQSDVNASFTLDVLEKSGQKRRRSFGHQQQQQDQFHHVYNNENHNTTPNERVSTDSIQLGNLEPYPGGTNFFSGLESPASFPSERRGFYSRMLETSSCGIFPFRAPEVVEPQSAASVFLTRNHADLFGARNHQRNLDTAEAATAQAMANFQALIDQGRSSASGFHAYSGSNATQTSTLPVLQRQTPSFTLLRSQQQLLQQQQQQQQRQQQQQQQQQRQQQQQQQQRQQQLQYQQQQLQQQLYQQQQYQQQQQEQREQREQQEQLHSNHGFSLNSSFELPTTTTSGFNYFSGFQNTNSSASLAFVPPAATGDDVANESYEANETYEANAEPAWPTLNCNTSVRNGSQSTLFHDPPSPCTPRAHTVLLSDAQEEYLQHMERLNSEDHLSADSPPPRGGRRLSYNPPVEPSDERTSQENRNHNSNYNIFHPFELDHPHEKHLHVYFDDSGIPQRVDVEDSAPQTVTQLDECAAVSGTRGIAGGEEFATTQQEENFSLRFDAPVAGGEKEISRDNTDQFDLNEVPVITVGDATPPTKPRKKYHPRVAKDKRTYKRRVDGKKVPATPGDGGANTDSPAKKSSKKRPTQYDFTHEEGRDSSYPEVVDMDIEDMTTPGVGTQHDTAVCDCEACIKIRLERRSSTALAPKSRFTLNSFDDTPQKAGSRHSPDSSSNSPSVRRTLFQARQGATARRLPLAVDDSSSEQANTVVVTHGNSTVRRLPLAFDDSSSEQANAAVVTQANPTAGRLPLNFDDSSPVQANSTAGRVPLAFDDPSSEQADAAVLSQANSTARRLSLAFDDPSSEQANAVVLSQANSTAGRLPLGFDDSSPKEANAVVLSLANSRLSLDFDDLSSPEEATALVISQANSRLQLALDDSSNPEKANAVVLSQANSTAFENVRSFFNDSSRSTCLQQFNESATQLGFSWEGRQQQEGDAIKSFDWNPPLAPRAPSSTTTSSSFLSRLCPRGILSPQKIPFRDMNQIQRVVYLKSILSANPQLTMSPESLLRHVHDHLPEEEKQEFQDSLWPVILKPLTEEQMKQLQEYANEERQQMVDGTPRLKRKPGPKPKKELLAMTLFPNLMPPAPTKKPVKPKKTPKKNSAEESLPQDQQSLQIVPYDDDNNNNKEKNEDTAMVPYENKTDNLNGDTAMVPYANQTSVIPYEGPIRKKKARPKVVLDGETVRVWKLLMGKPATTGEAEPASDEENERKWMEERRKMKAQALLFIDRMHVVQGDRSFSCWKGSVVDSVVGAFLTQNVNDVLSSSAFMSMRSRFPGRGFRRSPLQTQTPEDDTMAQSFESPPASATAPQTNQPSPQNLAPQFPPTSVTLLESQESRNEESDYAHLPKETAAPQPPVHNMSWTQTHEDSTASTISEVINPPEDPTSSLPRHELSASTISQVIRQSEDPTSSLPPNGLTASTISGTISQVFINQPEELSSSLPLSASTISEVTNPPEDMTSSLPLSRLSVSTISEVTNPPEEMTSSLPLNKLSVSTISEVTNHSFDTTSVVVPQSEPSKTCHSENSSGLDFQTLPEDPSSTTLVDVVVSSLPSTSTTSGSGALVEAIRDSAHGKYNPKTGLTGLERAKIEEKQVTARKSFDFSSLNEEFKPRVAGEHRAPGPPRTEMTEDGVDWEAVRAANVQEVADVIKERGLNWILAGRIKAFLERIHLDYGALDLEWLRSMSTDQTKEFLLSIRGLGLKSVECIRLLTLHHLAFPVDTNVGRICVRLGWVPLEPLPEELQLHLLELYPVQATIQKYLWPRLCKLDQQTLYELHYQMITFGKVFCTKSKPNCNACPMRPECKHFASALSSAKLALPASERPNNGPTLALPPGTEQQQEEPHQQDRMPEPSRPVSQYCQPIVEEPMTPESEADLEEFDIEDYPFSVEEVEDDTDLNICIQDPQAPTQLVLQSETINNPNCSSILSITDTYVTVSEPEAPVSAEVSASEPMPTTIMEDWGGLATSGSTTSVQNLGATTTTTTTCEESNCCQSSVIKIVESAACEEVLDLESNVNTTTTTPCEVLIHPNTGLSHEMVLVAPGAASLPVPKLKNVGRLRTVHYVYELPDNHPLLDGLDPREHDDPCTYLLAIWSPGEVPESIPNMNNTVDEENPFASSSSGDGEESIKATLLVPCRTAMQGSFPLNGTYFQVNEVFADHASSLQPMIVPRTLLWNLRRRFVFFGTSVTSIFRGMTVEEIQACFWRGYVCVRGFDRATRAPKPLVRRLHLQSGKSSAKEANMEN